MWLVVSDSGGVQVVSVDHFARLVAQGRLVQVLAGPFRSLAVADNVRECVAVPGAEVVSPRWVAADARLASVDVVSLVVSVVNDALSVLDDYAGDVYVDRLASVLLAYRDASLVEVAGGGYA